LFFPDTAQECVCRVADLSPGGASIEDCAQNPEAGRPVVLYLEGFGRFEGSVVRRDSRPGFGVRFNATLLKREKIAEQLTIHMNRDLLIDAPVVRSHDRTPTKGVAQFTRADGTINKCEVIDLSPTGVSLKTTIRPQIGEFVLIGQLAGRVARHHADGVGIQFVGLSLETPTPDQLQAHLAIAR
jgi:hypothetical protein